MACILQQSSHYWACQSLNNQHRNINLVVTYAVNLSFEAFMHLSNSLRSHIWQSNGLHEAVETSYLTLMISKAMKSLVKWN